MVGLCINVLVVIGVVVFIFSVMLVLLDSLGCIVVQIVFGIGFFGVGVIMCDGMNVCGFNIVVMLWCLVGIGVFCGLGQFWNVMVVMLIILCVNILLCEVVQCIYVLLGVGDEEKCYVLCVICLCEYENVVCQLLLNIVQQQRFILQGLQLVVVDIVDYLEICVQLISYKQY